MQWLEPLPQPEEAHIERLGENPRGLLSSNDELSGWVRQMDQYKSGDKGTDRQFWLSAWSNSFVSVDRKGRKEPLMVYRPFVAVAGGIQPGILSELKNNREDGLLDRFLFGYPDLMPTRWSDKEISEASRTAYKEIYDELYGLEMDTDENGSPDPIHATFDAPAKQLFVEAFDSLCEEMEQPGFPSHLKGPWSKMKGYLARLSLIVCMTYVVEPRNRRYGEDFYGVMKNNPMISERHVRAAVELLDYFKAHTRKVYAKLPGTGRNSIKQTQAKRGEEASEGNSVARFLVLFLEEQGGYWEGMTSKLYEICKANSVPGLPGGEGAFGKQIRKVVQDSYNRIVLEKGHIGKKPIIKLSLSTLGTVGNDKDTYIDSTRGTDSREDKDRCSEIADALVSLLEKNQEYEENRDSHDI